FVLTEQGVAASISVLNANVHVPGTTLNGTFAVNVQINTTTSSVTETFGTTTLTLPAGPYLRVEVIVPASSPITLAGGSLSGAFLLEQRTLPGADGDLATAADNEQIQVIGLSN